VELCLDRQLLVGGGCGGGVVGVTVATTTTSSASSASPLVIEAGGAVDVEECVERASGSGSLGASAGFAGDDLLAASA